MHDPSLESIANQPNSALELLMVEWDSSEQEYVQDIKFTFRGEGQVAKFGDAQSYRDFFSFSQNRPAEVYYYYTEYIEG